MLKPSVLMLVPDGKSIPESLERIKDFPLLLFPITPILINSLLLYSLKFFSPFSVIFISQPFEISLTDLISIIIS